MAMSAPGTGDVGRDVAFPTPPATASVVQSKTNLKFRVLSHVYNFVQRGDLLLCFRYLNIRVGGKSATSYQGTLLLRHFRRQPDFHLPVEYRKRTILNLILTFEK